VEESKIDSASRRPETKKGRTFALRMDQKKGKWLWRRMAEKCFSTIEATVRETQVPARQWSQEDWRKSWLCAVLERDREKNMHPISLRRGVVRQSREVSITENRVHRKVAAKEERFGVTGTFRKR